MGNPFARPQRYPDPDSHMKALLERACCLGDKADIDLNADLQAEIKTMFSPDNLSRVYTINSTNCSQENPGIDLEALRENFNNVGNVPDRVMEYSAGVILKHFKDIASRLQQSQHDISLLRCLPILMECPAFKRPDETWGRQLIVMMCRTLNKLGKSNSSHFKVLVNWWRHDQRLLRRTVQVIHEGFLGLRKSKAYTEICTLDVFIESLKLLNAVNEDNCCIIPRQLFYVPNLELCTNELCTHLNVYMFATFAPRFFNINIPSSISQVFKWLDVPFMLNVKTKWILFNMSTCISKNITGEMFNLVNNELYWQDIFLSGLDHHRIVPCRLVFHDIDRQDIIASALENVKQYWNDDNISWLRTLEVNFKGEFALDAGGPTKEFFHLLFRELTNTDKFPMFRRMNEQSLFSHIWFNENYEDWATLSMIGRLFGLLIYSGTIITLPFPTLLYEKLLNDSPFLPEDLVMIDHMFWESLSYWKTCPESELEFLDFTVVNSAGKTVELLPDGTSIPVTKNNVALYTELYAKFKLAERQFLAFKDGFKLFNNEFFKSLFKPEEMRDVILGETFEWEIFEKSTRYEKPYHEGHPVIIMFWRVFHSLDERDKRNYLEFLTGAPHVPIRGFQSLDFRIKLLNTDEQDPAVTLPEVMTCAGYISMDLPPYRSEDEVRDRLLTAIDICHSYNRERPPQAAAH